MDEIIVNGAPRRLAEGETVDGLLRELRLDPRWVVAEVNGEPLPRDRFVSTVLSAGDRIELVRPVAGG